jgi:hypothetical protein
LKEHEKDDRSGKGSKLLILEAKTRELGKTGTNRLSAVLHLRCPPGMGVGYVFVNIIDTQFPEVSQVTMCPNRREISAVLCNQRDY